MLSHWSKWFFSVLNAVLLRVIFNEILVDRAGLFQHVSIAVKQPHQEGEKRGKKIITNHQMLLLHLLFLYLFIYLLVHLLLLLWPRGSWVALGSRAPSPSFQPPVCGTSESFAAPGPYTGAELHNLIWPGVVLWRRHLLCNLRQDTELLCECSPFRER